MVVWSARWGVLEVFAPSVSRSFRPGATSPFGGGNDCSTRSPDVRAIANHDTQAGENSWMAYVFSPGALAGGDVAVAATEGALRRAARLIPVVAHSHGGCEGLIVLFDLVECDALALAKETEHAAVQRTGAEIYLAGTWIKHNNTGLCAGIVCLDETLHGGFLSLLDFAGFETRRANTNALGVGTVPHSDPLDVWGPAAVGALV